MTRAGARLGMEIMAAEEIEGVHSKESDLFFAPPVLAEGGCDACPDSKVLGRNEKKLPQMAYIRLRFMQCFFW